MTPGRIAELWALVNTCVPECRSCEECIRTAGVEPIEEPYSDLCFMEGRWVPVVSSLLEALEAVRTDRARLQEEVRSLHDETEHLRRLLEDVDPLAAATRSGSSW